MSKSFTTQAIATALNGRLIGNGNIVVDRVAHPADVTGARDLALAVDTKLLPLLAESQAKAAIISSEAELEPGLIDACIVVDRPRLALAKLTNLFANPVKLPEGIHPTAVIEDGAQIAENVTIGAYAYICAGAIIGAGSVLHPQTYVGPNAVLGRDALIYPGVKIGANVHIGDRVIIHFNSSIGADGFSFVTPQQGSVEAVKETGVVSATNQEFVRIASLGAVILADDVEVGANTSIDRGTIASTRIGKGTKIDNQVQIGHNVTIGENCLICGRAGIAGSASIGNRVVLGGAAGVADHLKIGDDAIVMAMAGVAGNVLPRTVVGGFPATPRGQLIENHFYFGRIKHFMKKLESFTKRLDDLEKKGEG